MTPAFKLTVNGQTYDVNVGDLAASPVSVTVDGVQYSVDLPAGRATSAPPPRAASRPSVRPLPAPASTASPPPSPAAASGNTINAPIPGRILSVLVGVGDSVASGQGVVVMESMKMEQTIASPRGGTVKAVLVSAGDAAAYGQAMVELE